MPFVTFDPNIDTLQGIKTGDATVTAMPLRRRMQDGKLVMKSGITVKVNQQPVSIYLEPTAKDNAWCISITDQRGEAFSGYYIVPDVEIVDFVELKEVDPESLEPTAKPDPVWWAMAENTVESGVVDSHGHLILTHYSGKQSDAGIVKGAKGAKGDKGDPGVQGATGAKGDKGDPGVQGAKGDKGDPGVQGATGAKGDKGDSGVQGAKGDKGDPGAKGATGATGAKGDKGDPGVQGATGAKGDKGDKGDPGVQGATGAKGDKGDPGADSSSTTVNTGNLFTASANWSINSQSSRKIGNIYFYELDVTFSGSDVSVGTDGDFSTVVAAQLSTVVPSITTSVTSTGYGVNVNAMLQTNKNFALVSGVPGMIFNSGKRFSFAGSFPVA